MEENKELLKFAVVGCGHIGKRHATMISRNPNCELVALCDVQPKSLLELEEFDVPFYADLDSMLVNEQTFDILCVCTPNGLHAAHALKGLNAANHVICEKPMALNRADCEEILHTALNKQRQIFCVMQNRYSPPSEWLKEVLTQGHLGKIYMVEINCYWNRDDRYYFKNGSHHPWKGTIELDGGTLFTQFSHFIDIVYWLFGDIKNVQTRLYDFKHGHSTEFEDSGIVHFDFVKEGCGSLTFSTAVWAQNLESSMTIIGEKGSIKVGGQYMNEVVECNIENYEMPELRPSNPANFYGHYWGSAANHHYIFENVVDVFQNGVEATTNALEGMKVIDIIEKIYNAAPSRPIKSIKEKATKSV